MRTLPAWLATPTGHAVLGVTAATLVAAGLVASPLVSFNSPTSKAPSGGTDDTGSALSGTTSGSAAKPGNNGNNGSAGGKTFTISGNVIGLVPGGLGTIPLTIRNNASQTMRVRSLTVTAADGRDSNGASVCSASLLHLGAQGTARSGSVSPVDLLIAGNGTNATPFAFPVALDASAGNACKNVSWQLTYSGTGDQA